ncbi:MAG: cyanophycinase [Planctomycetales bacterium]|jgi:beta-aspartyl-peptidase (threonine type)
MKRLFSSGNRASLLCLLAVGVFVGATSPASADDGILVVVGGGTIPDTVIDRFVELAGSDEARLVVIPTASSDGGLATSETIAELWGSRGINHTDLLHTRDRNQANDDAFVKPLKDATAVWISGGQQSRLAAAYVGTRVQAELQALLKRGGVIGGSSAGAAIQSGVMIESGNLVPKISRGLDLIPNTIIDQHFLRRNRMNRLIEAVNQHPDRMGIGIDESTAAIVHGNRAEVVGDSYVTIVSSSEARPLAMQTLRAGDQFELTGVTEKADKKPPRHKWAIAIHGGAGTVSSDASPEEVQAWRDGLRLALEKCRTIVKGGGTGLDAVEATIRMLEDNSMFNAGKGAVFNSAGAHELDASIMDGRTLDGGAVAGVTTVRNPIGLARLVMNRTRHVLLSGPGAEQFATEQNVDRVKNTYYSTERRRESWNRVREREAEKPVSRISPAQPWQYGTVGCVVLDVHGNLAAGTSTGGLTNKKFGRVGDSPILGAGTYADNDTCAVSATGTGEQFIRHTVAAQISQLMRHRRWTLKQSADYVLKQRLNKGDGGVIAIDRDGNIEWVFTSPGMFRAAADSAGRFDVRIRDEK